MGLLSGSLFTLRSIVKFEGEPEAQKERDRDEGPARGSETRKARK